jgi:spoIIIJ-associated protein
MMVSKKKGKSLSDSVKKISEDLLGLMGMDLSVEVSEDKENSAVMVKIPAGYETGLLIGSRGNTLNSLQNIISLIVRQETGEWVRILVDIADWREKEIIRLEELAEQTAERALSTSQPQTLYNLTPAQRRIVHMSLSKNKKVTTESQGDGEERYLVVSPK